MKVMEGVMNDVTRFAATATMDKFGYLFSAVHESRAIAKAEMYKVLGIPAQVEQWEEGYHLVLSGDYGLEECDEQM